MLVVNDRLLIMSALFKISSLSFSFALMQLHTESEVLLRHFLCVLHFALAHSYKVSLRKTQVEGKIIEDAIDFMTY